MSSSIDELMRLASQHASAHAEWVLKGSDAATQEDATYAALRSALEEVGREVQHLQMAANSEAQRGDELAADAKRYRWLRNEAWGGHVAGRRFPHVVEFKAGLRPGAITELAEEALDAAIDAAMQQAPEQEG